MSAEATRRRPAHEPLDLPDDAGVHFKSEEGLLRRFCKTRDPALRDELLKRYSRFAESMAGRYRGKGETTEDLNQVAYLGLLYALDRFDPDRGKPFIAFAAPTVLGELRRHLRDKVWLVRLPRALQDRTRKVEAATGRLSARLGRPPKVGEIADELGLSEEDVLDAIEATSQRRVNSLDRPLVTDDPDSETAVARLGKEDGGYEEVEDRSTAHDLLSTLSDSDRELLRMRFVEDLTQAQIGERLGCSQMHVSRMLRDLLARMHSAYAASKSAIPAG